MSAVKGSRSIEIFILLSALCIAVGCAIFGMKEKIPGAIAGGLVAYLNFFFIRVIVLKALGRQDKIRFAIAMLYGVKFLAVVFLVYLIVRSNRFDMAGFLAGFSSLLAGIVFEGIRRAVWEEKEPEDNA